MRKTLSFLTKGSWAPKFCDPGDFGVRDTTAVTARVLREGFPWEMVGFRVALAPFPHCCSCMGTSRV